VGCAADPLDFSWTKWAVPLSPASEKPSNSFSPSRNPWAVNLMLTSFSLCLSRPNQGPGKIEDATDLPCPANQGVPRFFPIRKGL